MWGDGCNLGTELRSKDILGGEKCVGKYMWKGKNVLNLLVVSEVHGYV